MGMENSRNGGCARDMGMSAGVHGFAWGGLLLLVLILLGLSQGGEGGNVWHGWRPSVELLRPIYLERIYPDAVFRTRANTWSNLAYVLAGLYALGIGWRDRRLRRPHGGFLARTPVMSLVFGLACCYLGVGSGLFHASLTRFGQHLDVAAMYAPLAALIAISLGRRLPRRTPAWQNRTVPTSAILIALVAIACWLLFLYKWSMSMPLVLGSLILAVFLLGLMDSLAGPHGLDIRWVAGSAATLVAGIACRQIEIAGAWPAGPDAWLQGHALWHIFTTLSLGCMYLFYRSDTGVPRPART